MARTLADDSTRSFDLTASPITALAEIAAALASGEPLEEAVPRVLEAVRRVLDAEECVLWLYAPRGLVRAWDTGEARTDASDVAR